MEQSDDVQRELARFRVPALQGPVLVGGASGEGSSCSSTSLDSGWPDLINLDCSDDLARMVPSLIC